MMNTTLFRSLIIVLLFLFFNYHIDIVNSQPTLIYSYSRTILVGKYCPFDQVNKREYIDGYALLNYTSKLVATNEATIDGTPATAVTTYFNHNFAEQVLYINIASPISSTGTTILNNSVIVNLKDPNNSSLWQVPIGGISCHSFRDQPLILKSNGIIQASMFDARLSIVTFIVEFGQVPTDNIDCVEDGGQFNCICHPYDYGYKLYPVRGKIFLKCSLAPLANTFTGWDNAVNVTFSDKGRVNIGSVSATVDFPFMANWNTSTTVFNNVTTAVKNRTWVDIQSQVNQFSVYANVSNWNSQFIVYKADGGVIPSTGVNYYGNTYKPLLADDNGNALIHFALPQSMTAANVPATLTSTSISTLNNASILATNYTHYQYPYNNTATSSHVAYDGARYVVTPVWKSTAAAPFIKVQANSLLNNFVQTVKQPFPYGLKKGIPSTGKYDYAFDQPVHPNFVSNKLTVWGPHNERLAEGETNSGKTGTSSRTPLFIVSSFRKFTSHQTVFGFKVKYNDGFGFQGGYIPFDPENGVYIRASDHSYTDNYEVELNITQTEYGRRFRFHLLSLDGKTQRLYQQNDVIQMYFHQPTVLNAVPATGLLEFSIDEVSELFWSPPTVGVTLGPAKSILSFKLATTTYFPNINDRPAVMIYKRHKSNVYDFAQYFMGKYEGGYYKVEVTIDQGSFPGPAEYFIASSNTNITSEALRANPLVGDNAILTIVCQNTDEMGPIVGCVSPPSYSINVTSPQEESVTLQWTVNIQDRPSGIALANSYAIVTSDIDPTPRRVSLVQVSGDVFSGVYSVTHSARAGASCEIFKLDLVLTDSLGNVATSIALGDLDNNQINVDPFHYLPDHIGRYISVLYSAAVVDTDPPVLVDLSFFTTVPVDVSLYNRTVEFQFTLYDQVSGVSLASTPYLYVTGLNGESASCAGVVISMTNDSLLANPGNVTYQCNVELPYGFGYQTSPVVSIYGYSDNSRNFGSQTSADLLAKGFVSSFAVVMNNIQPIILSTSGIPTITAAAKPITIRGRRLIPLDSYTFTRVNLFVNDNPTAVQTATPSFYSHTVITCSLDGNLFQPTDNVKIQITYTYSAGGPVITRISNFWNLTYAPAIPYNPIPEPPAGAIEPFNFYTPSAECPVPLVLPPDQCTVVFPSQETDDFSSSSSYSDSNSTSSSDSGGGVTPPGDDDDDSGGGLSAGAIGGIAAGAFVLAALLALAIVFARRRSKRRSPDQEMELEQKTVPMFVGGKVNNVDEF